MDFLQLPFIFLKRRNALIRLFSEKSGDQFTGIPNQHTVSNSDRFWLKYTRTMAEKDIGKEISVSMMQKAVERRRIATNIGVMLIGTITLFFVLRSTRQKRDAKLAELMKE
ncbi:uncharacterized protein LOC100198852 isoform X1 [Hydra vulgaris]|uniref:uncharacterized protein LOC100198852 isoform X1 n=1 Tax=Hydra vulgaris TaxID=6087 RepID=UPI000640EA21|nr:uncharacterized protein LOC100198852 [Hydra vulgaris]